MSEFHLIASRDFGRYARGQRIEDDAEIARILAGEHAAHVVRVHKHTNPPVALTAAEKAPAASEAQPEKQE